MEVDKTGFLTIHKRNEVILLAVKREELIRNYAKAIREGNAAIFGGAGLSRPSGYVDWKDLLRPLASDIGLDVERHTNTTIRVTERLKRPEMLPLNTRLICRQDTARSSKQQMETPLFTTPEALS